VAVDDNVRYCLALLSSFDETVKGVRSTSAHPAEHSAHQLVASMLDIYPLTNAQRGMIRLELEEDFQVTTLPNCVSLVLSSLLGHTLRALKDSQKPSICFTVAAGDHPHIRIADNGPGIPPDVLDKLAMDPIATRTDSAGPGLGLIFCKRIMQVFGGDMMIRSVQGIYTTITLYFPPVKGGGAAP
jgi:two-component system response regulator PhcR